MIEVARKKASRMSRGSKVPKFFEIDMRKIQLNSKKKNGNKFDVVSTLFGGFGYLLHNADVLKFFNSAKAHLNSRGLLIFEFWHVTAVNPQSSSKSWVKVEVGDRTIIRLDASKYDPQTNLIRVLFDFYILDRKRGERVDSFSETHE